MKKIIFLLFVLSVNTVIAVENTGNSFQDITDPQQYILAERKAAQAEDKLLLWVLGAEWCHDSRSLASKLASDELAGIIKAHYRLTQVSVGYLDAGFEFTQMANMKTFYATPTVLILNPETMQLLNRDDMHLWANAYQVSMADTVEYFSRYSQMKFSPVAEYTAQQRAKLKQLNGFIQHQEQRIRDSYKIIGPMLADYKAGISNPDFDPSWLALARLRMSLPEIIEKNKKSIESTPEQELELTSEALKPLPWEKAL